MIEEEDDSDSPGKEDAAGRQTADEKTIYDGLSLKQQNAIIALLREPTIGKAAVAAQVGERTLYRWLDQPAFAAAYRKARRDAFGQAIGLTQKYAPVAVSTLAQVMTDPKAPHHAKVSAATALLKFGREGMELDDLAARVEALEQQAEDREQRSGRFSGRAA